MPRSMLMALPCFAIASGSLLRRIMRASSRIGAESGAEGEKQGGAQQQEQGGRSGGGRQAQEQRQVLDMARAWREGASSQMVRVGVQSYVRQYQYLAQPCLVCARRVRRLNWLLLNCRLACGCCARGCSCSKKSVQAFHGTSNKTCSR